MKVNLNNQFPGQRLPFYVRRSTYVHVGLVLLTLVSGKIVISQQEKLRNANMELISASVKVDMVAMPKYTLNELKNLSSGVEEAKKEEVAPEVTAKVEPEKVIEEKVVAKAEEKDTGPTFEEANKKKRQDFLSKLKDIGSKKIKDNGNVKAEKGLYGDKSTDLKQLVLAGNKLSKGSAMYGDSNAGDLTAFQAYVVKLPDIVRSKWILPTFLEGKKLKCRVRVWVALNGEVFRAEVYQSSGEPEFDKRAVDAVKAASPFPRLSDDIAKRALNGDIGLGFPL